MGIGDYSTTPASNTAISGINIAEGCPPSGINNAIRQMMADIATAFPVTSGNTNFSSAQNWAQGTDIIAAATTPIGAATGNFVNVTGNTGIGAFDTVQAGTWRAIRFTGTPLLAYNAASFILPGGVNLQVAAGDTSIWVSLGSGSWLCLSYTTASGVPIGVAPLNNPTFTGTPAAPTAAANTNTTQIATTAMVQSALLPSITRLTSGTGTYTVPTGTTFLKIKMVGGGGGGQGGGAGINTYGNTGATGGSTTFGTSLLSCNGGGGGGIPGGVSGGVGGSASLGVITNGVALTGVNGGTGSQTNNSETYVPSGAGGGSPWGGAGTAVGSNAGGCTATAYGSGGSGGSSPNSLPSTNQANTGAGGGAGGYLEAVITSPASSYAYAVGSGGSAGSGNGGQGAGSGFGGVIIIEAY